MSIRVVHRPKYKGPFSIDYREQVSYTGYLAHKNNKGEVKGRSRHKNNSKRVVKKSERKEHGHEGEKSQTRPN